MLIVVALLYFRSTINTCISNYLVFIKKFVSVLLQFYMYVLRNCMHVYTMCYEVFVCSVWQAFYFYICMGIDLVVIVCVYVNSCSMNGYLHVTY
jgi:hypothetical protein